MQYAKSWLSLEQQADLLIEEKGMTADRAFLLERLREIGYYRLSAYWFPYKITAADGPSRFRPGTDFSHIWRTYQFDRELRLVMFDAVGHVEIFTRSQVAHLASRDDGIFAYPPEAIAHLEREYRRAKQSEIFMRHFEKTYGDSHDLPPYWMMVEAIPLGSLEILYSHLGASTRTEIAGLFGVKVPVLKNWLSVIRVARNACCHHARVWNRTWGVRPMIPRSWQDFKTDTRKTFSVLSILNYMMGRIDGENRWKQDVARLLERYEDIPKREVGFPDDWETLGVWSIP